MYTVVQKMKNLKIITVKITVFQKMLELKLCEKNFSKKVYFNTVRIMRFVC